MLTGRSFWSRYKSIPRMNEQSISNTIFYFPSRDAGNSDIVQDVVGLHYVGAGYSILMGNLMSCICGRFHAYADYTLDTRGWPVDSSRRMILVLTVQNYYLKRDVGRRSHHIDCHPEVRR